MTPQMPMPMMMPMPPIPVAAPAIAKPVELSEIIGELAGRAYVADNEDYHDEIRAVRNCLLSGSAHSEIVTNLRNSATSCFAWIQDENFREKVNMCVFSLNEDDNA